MPVAIVQGMPGDEDRNRVVIRFSGWGAESLKSSVDKQVLGDIAKGRAQRHGVSVFADVTRDDESFEETVIRLAHHATQFVNGPRVAVLTEANLKEHDYCLHEAVPPELHYLIGGKDLGSPPPPLEKLAELLKDKRKNPAFEKQEKNP